MYKPKNGDWVTVTTTAPGRAPTWITGVIQEITQPGEAPTWNTPTFPQFGGFRITGTNHKGQAEDTYASNAATLRHYYGVHQTIEPAERPS